MLENIGKAIGEIITKVLVFILSIVGKILAPVGAGMVQALPWYVKVIIVIIIISALLPILKVIFQGLRLIFGKFFKK